MEEWKVQICDGRYTFVRIIDGAPVESYAPVHAETAAVWAVSIIHGFQPPRGLSRLDTPTGQTPPAACSESVA